MLVILVIVTCQQRTGNCDYGTHNNASNKAGECNNQGVRESFPTIGIEDGDLPIIILHSMANLHTDKVIILENYCIRSYGSWRIH